MDSVELSDRICLYKMAIMKITVIISGHASRQTPDPFAAPEIPAGNYKKERKKERKKDTQRHKDTKTRVFLCDRL